MVIKVIGASFGRTATLSLKHALETLLSARCYHMHEVIENPKNASHIQLWQEATGGRDIDWASMLADYEAIVDWPGCRFYKELLTAFPQAKVILTKRNFDSWYESVLTTIYQVSMIPLPWLTPHKIKCLYSMLHAVVWNGTFQGKFLDKEFARGIYESHIADVANHVPPDRLLIFEPQQGWGPLCRFLDLPCPSIPFPHLNDTNEFRARTRQIVIRTKIAWFLGHLIIALIAGSLIYVLTLLFL